jgi:hypothetical protein
VPTSRKVDCLAIVPRIADRLASSNTASELAACPVQLPVALVPPAYLPSVRPAKGATVGASNSTEKIAVLLLHPSRDTARKELSTL